MVVDGNSIYVTDDLASAVVRYTHDEGGHLVMKPGSVYMTGAGGLSSIAIDDSYVYITDYKDGDITKVNKEVFRETPGVVNNAFRPGDVRYLAIGLNHPDHIVADDDHIYWTEGNTWYDEIRYGQDGGTPSGAIRRMAKNGGEVETLASGLLAPSSLTMAGRRLYFATPQKLWSLAVDGQASPTVASQGNVQLGTGGIATDGQSVFFGFDDSVRRLSVSGTAQDDILYAASDPAFLVVDETQLFWVSFDQIIAAKKK